MIREYSRVADTINNSFSFCYNALMNNEIINQYLPTYKEDFKDDRRWIGKETLHYILYYFLGSVAEKEINIIEEIQEESFKKIIGFLNVEPPKQKIRYYFYPDIETKIKLMGDGGYAQAIGSKGA